MKELFVEKCFVEDIETNRGLIAYQYAESLSILEEGGKNSFFFLYVFKQSSVMGNQLFGLL